MEPHEIHALANIAEHISLGAQLDDWKQVHKGITRLLTWLHEERARTERHRGPVAVLRPCDTPESDREGELWGNPRWEPCSNL